MVAATYNLQLDMQRTLNQQVASALQRATAADLAPQYPTYPTSQSQSQSQSRSGPDATARQRRSRKAGSRTPTRASPQPASRSSAPAPVPASIANPVVAPFVVPMIPTSPPLQVAPFASIDSGVVPASVSQPFPVTIDQSHFPALESHSATSIARSTSGSEFGAAALASMISSQPSAPSRQPSVPSHGTFQALSRQASQSAMESTHFAQSPQVQPQAQPPSDNESNASDQSSPPLCSPRDEGEACALSHGCDHEMGPADMMQDSDTDPAYALECVICSKPVDSVLYRCGHMCVCNLCARHLKVGNQCCPLCRAPIDDIVRVFSA